MKFSSRKIHAHSLGDILKEKREEKGLTLSQVERELKIGKIYLQALETGNYDNLPSIIYGRKFLERYANFLGLAVPDLMDKFNEEAKFFFKKPILTEAKPKLKKIEFRYILLIIIAIVLVGYLVLEILPIISPPFLEVYSPSENQVVYQPFITIKGKTEEGAMLYINDNLLTDFTGPEFEKNLELRPGLNRIEISAKKEHSRETTVVREVIVIE